MWNAIGRVGIVAGVALIALVALITFRGLAGCEKGPPQFGTIHGRVTESVLGGAPDANDQGVVTVKALTCRVSIKSKSGKYDTEVITNANGEFQFRNVRVGHYSVSFEACGDVCGHWAPQPRTIEVDVTRNGNVDASWVCSYNAG
jgi:hypothetical protein